MQKAKQAFQKGKYQQAQQLYTKIIDQKQQNYHFARLNRSSLRYTMNNYLTSLSDIEQFLKQQNKQPQAFILYFNNLIRLCKKKNNQHEQWVKYVKNNYPNHLKLKQVLKNYQQMLIVEDDQQYMQRMFEKLIQNPEICKFLKDESFLTKVQKMIRNPSLTHILVKMDPRLQHVSQTLLMAQQQK